MSLITTFTDNHANLGLTPEEQEALWVAEQSHSLDLSSMGEIPGLFDGVVSELKRFENAHLQRAQIEGERVSEIVHRIGQLEISEKIHLQEKQALQEQNFALQKRVQQLEAVVGMHSHKWIDADSARIAESKKMHELQALQYAQLQGEIDCVKQAYAQDMGRMKQSFEKAEANSCRIEGSLRSLKSELTNHEIDQFKKYGELNQRYSELKLFSATSDEVSEKINRVMEFNQEAHAKFALKDTVWLWRTNLKNSISQCQEDITKLTKRVTLEHNEVFLHRYKTNDKIIELQTKLTDLIEKYDTEMNECQHHTATLSKGIKRIKKKEADYETSTDKSIEDISTEVKTLNQKLTNLTNLYNRHSHTWCPNSTHYPTSGVTYR